MESVPHLILGAGHGRPHAGPQLDWGGAQRITGCRPPPFFFLFLVIALRALGDSSVGVPKTRKSPAALGFNKAPPP